MFLCPELSDGGVFWLFHTAHWLIVFFCSWVHDQLFMNIPRPNTVTNKWLLHKMFKIVRLTNGWFIPLGSRSVVSCSSSVCKLHKLSVTDTRWSPTVWFRHHYFTYSRVRGTMYMKKHIHYSPRFRDIWLSGEISGWT